jgi:DNA gyrase subunit A
VGKDKGEVIPIAIEDEIKVSYLNYAMSVIVSRALPDVRDGLKPVHRRILFTMNEMGLRSDRAFKKCGRIVGDVLGKYHPHGDQSIYDALVRLAQTFTMRYPLVNGQGNFGSVDGDPPAAMRYTEAKMEAIAETMLRDIKKETVDFGPNYDDTMKEPLVLPATLPCLLVNGASGIAVGMATNIPPHNLREVSQALIALIEDPEISIEGLTQHIKGPDFPLGGIIFGKKGIREAYKTGKGRITVRARCILETAKSGKDIIIVNELPYMVNKANLIVRIADLVKNRKIEGIADLRDESDKTGIRIVIELKRGATPKIVLNQLFSHTQLQQNFGVNNLALVNGKPRLLDLKGLLQAFIDHRKDVIIRRTQYELRKAEERAHILEGLKIALENIDEVIRIIKGSKTVEDARNTLMSAFKLSERQAQAILDMRLQKLTSLETQKILDELKEIQELIAYLKELLENEEKILEVIKEETREIEEKYGDERRTEIVPDEVEEIDVEDLIQEEDVVVLISNKGFIKRIPLSAYRRQGRGGKGSSSTILKNEDFIEHIFIASTHNYILFISSEGKAYWLKVHQIPEGSKGTRGQPIKTLISVSPDEEITTVLSIEDFRNDSFIVMATSRGVVKKVVTSAFSHAKTHGVIAIRLDQGDRLISAIPTNGESEIVLVTRKGYTLRFHEEAIRSMGRSSRGVQGIRLSERDELTGILSVDHDEEMLLVTEYGYGKRMTYENFTPHGRATRGQRGYKVSDKTGEVVDALSIRTIDDVMCITSQGNTVKLKLKEIPVMSKAAQGVRIVHIQKPDYLVGVARVARED